MRLYQSVIVLLVTVAAGLGGTIRINERIAIGEQLPKFEAGVSGLLSSNLLFYFDFTNNTADPHNSLVSVSNINNGGTILSSGGPNNQPCASFYNTGTSSAGGKQIILTGQPWHGFPFTYAAWVNCTNDGFNQNFWQSTFTNTTGHYLPLIRMVKYPTAGGGNGSNSVDFATGSTEAWYKGAGSIADGTWQHIVFTVDANSNCVVYSAGVPVTTNVIAGGGDAPRQFNWQSITIGVTRTVGGAWQGEPLKITDFGVWTNRCLNASEVLMLYTNGNGLSYNELISL